MYDIVSIPFHPLANLVPAMDPGELAQLVEDVRTHGLREPITLYDGQILDGRHRYAACRLAGVALRWELYEGDDPVAFVLSKNLHRRHLTSAQKAAIAAAALPALEAQARERQGTRTDLAGPEDDNIREKIPESSRARDRAAALTGTNPRYVSEAKRLAQDAPDVFEAMKSGAVSMTEAKALANQSEPGRKAVLNILPTMTKAERKAQLQLQVVRPGLAIPDDEPEEDREGEDRAVHFSSESSEWATPAVVLDRVAALMGGIDLDPCSDPQHTVPATMHYTADQDGLRWSWRGRIFMNPPYGRTIDAWIAKLVEEFEAGRVTQAVALVPARTDTAWWRRLGAFPVAFWRGRLAFIGPDGAVNPAPFPSALVALGMEPGRLADAFAEVADVYRRVRE